MMAFEFKDWSWDLVGFVAAFAAAAAQKLWRGYLDRRSETWPISYGRIDRANVDSDKKTAKITCYYTYSVGTEKFVGQFKMNFDTSNEAEAWVDALNKKQVAVHYDPGKPERSRLRQIDLAPIVQAAAPLRPARAEPIPAWRHALALAGLLLSGAGLVISIGMLLGELTGKALVPMQVAVYTASFAYFVFLGGIWIFQQDKRKARATSAWMKFLGYALLYYAIFAAIIPHGAGHEPPQGIARRHKFQDARYLLFLYFSAFEACYGQLRGEDENPMRAGIGELR